MTSRLRLALDTNVALDLLMRRGPFEHDAAELFAAAARHQLEGLLVATSITTVYYVVAKAYGSARALEDVRRLLSLFDIAPVTRPVLDDAAAHPGRDFEDAVLAFAARHAGATGIVTRDPTGFAGAPLPVYTPAEALALLAAR